MTDINYVIVTPNGDIEISGLKYRSDVLSDKPQYEDVVYNVKCNRIFYNNIGNYYITYDPDNRILFLSDQFISIAEEAKNKKLPLYVCYINVHYNEDQNESEVVERQILHVSLNPDDVSILKSNCNVVIFDSLP